MAFYPAHARFNSKQFFSADRKNRYDRLVEKVFEPLRDASDRVGDIPFHGDYNQLHLRFDLPKIKSSLNYPEAIEHLDNDLPANITKPEELFEYVQDYNVDVNNFFRKTIPERCREALRQIQGLTIIENANVSLPNNSVSLPNIASDVTACYISNLEPVFNYEGGVLSGFHVKPLARIDEQLVETIENVIRQLINDRLILRVLNGNLSLGKHGLRYRRNELIELGENLASSIYAQIIFKIENETYTYVCSRCPKIENQTT